MDRNLRRVQRVKQEAIPKEKFKDIIREKVGEEDNYLNTKDCIICYNQINEESFVTDLPDCHHLYHHRCISEWFKINSKCPLCKKDYLDKFNNLIEPANEDIIEIEPLINPER